MRCGAFFSAEIAKVEISWFAPSVDDRSTLAMPVDTVEAECAMRTLKGREVGRYEGGKVTGFMFAPLYLPTFSPLTLSVSIFDSPNPRWIRGVHIRA